MSQPYFGPGDWSFLSFIRGSMGIPIAAMADNNAYLPSIYAMCLDIVNVNLALIPQVGGYQTNPAGSNPTLFPTQNYPNQYALAIYNLGGDRIIALMPDSDPFYPYPGVTPPQGYFAYLRSKFNVDSFSTGVVTYTSDLSTAASFQVSDWQKNMTLGDLENLKTPWGRRYMAIAQQYGPTIVGIT